MTRKGAVDQTFIDEPDPENPLASSLFHNASSLSGSGTTPAESNPSGFGSSGFFGAVHGPHISAPAHGMNVLKTVQTSTHRPHHHHHHHARGPHHLRNALSPSPSSEGSGSGSMLSTVKEQHDRAKSAAAAGGAPVKRPRSASAGKARKPVMTRGTTTRGNGGKTDAMVAMEWNDNVEVRLAPSLCPCAVTAR